MELLWPVTTTSPHTLSTELSQILDLSTSFIFTSFKNNFIQECHVDFSFHQHFALFTLAIECNDSCSVVWCDVKSFKVAGKYSMTKKNKGNNRRKKGTIFVSSPVYPLRQDYIAAVVGKKKLSSK
jgi:hypothetical protein